MRSGNGHFTALVVGLTLASFALAGSADAAKRDCRRLTRQIDRYQDVAVMAEDRGNELWEAETNRHIRRLEVERAKKCPEFAHELIERNRAQKLAYEMGRAVQSAGKVFLRYMTFGAY